MTHEKLRGKRRGITGQGDRSTPWNAASCMLQIHIYWPPSRPNSVLKVGSHPPPLCRERWVRNVQDGVARSILYGWSGASDSDQGCCAVGFFGRRTRTGSE